VCGILTCRKVALNINYQAFGGRVVGKEWCIASKCYKMFGIGQYVEMGIIICRSMLIGVIVGCSNGVNRIVYL